jgi:CBS domain-containing protein
MAAIDPVAYLRSIHPFHALPAPLFEDAARHLEVGLFQAGTWLVRVGQRPLEHLYVIRKGVVRLERDGKTLQILEEGEVFGYTSLITGAATLDVLVEEDLLAYRLPGEVFRRLLADAQFAGHFAVGLSERLRSSLEHSPVATFEPDLSLRVEELVRREPVWVEPGQTVGDAARLMAELNISSVLVRTDPPGILTDRDFRKRVLAAGQGPEVPVTQVFSRPLRTVAGDTPIHDAWATLLDAGVHHLPVTRDGTVVGVITSTDLLRSTAQGPMSVLRGVERLASPDKLPGYAQKVTQMTAMLLAGGLDATVIAGLVARLNDALVRRILRWAEADLGPAPAPYAWIAFGSEGRMEQTLLTDQDNALVYADAGVPRRDWFQALAERANRDLEAAGFPRCPGGYMARSWNGPLSEWTARFAGWLDVPSPEAVLVASIFFDFRRVGGELDLEPLEALVERAAGKSPFLRFLAQDALRFHPPPMMLLRLRGSSTVDLKLHGISPVVAMARRYGLGAGSDARTTLGRLEAATRAGLLEEEAREAVSEAYRFLLGLRLRLQLRQLKEGKPAANEVSLHALSAMERSRLKDAFRAIRHWQERSAFRFQAEA